MTIWDNILRLRFLCCRSRVVSRFVNELKKKINEPERCLTALAFFRDETHDSKELSVHCIDKYIKNFNRQSCKIWEIGDNKVFKKAHKNKALARGDLFIKDVEKICYDKDRKRKLFVVPSWFDTHCNIKPAIEDFHENDVRVAKLADASHLVKRAV